MARSQKHNQEPRDNAARAIPGTVQRAALRAGAALLPLLAASPAAATDYHWTAGTGDWFTPGNWDASAIPVAPSLITSIDNGGTAQVQAPGAWANYLYVGDSGTGTLAVSSGGTLSNYAFTLGSNAGSHGTATVNGAGATWTLVTGMTVGNNGTGTLTIGNGGAVSAASGSGFIGRNAGGTGTLTVDGAGSTWTSATFRVGEVGTGTVNITGGGKVNVGGGTASADLARTGGSATLNIGNGGSAGVLNANAVNGGSGSATLNFNHSDGAYYFTTDGTSSGTAISITGSTRVSQIGSGKTILTGNNTYAGGTTVSAGTLQSGAAGAFAGNTAYTVNGGTLNLNGYGLTMSALSGSGGSITLGSAALTVDQNTITTFAGNMSGTGTLTKSGTGALTLTGTNSYSGTTTVSGGTLKGNTNSLQGTITNNAAVTFDQSTNGTYSGNMGGSGSLTKSGTGTLTLTGTNGYGGDTIISSGTLQVGNGGTTGTLGNGNVTDNGTLVFNRSDTLTYAGAISGTGGVTQSGTGTVVLNGSNSYRGTTTIGAGTLEVGDAGHGGASLGSNVTVGSSGTLRGHGTITGAVTNAGTLRPGGSVGTLTVSGSTSFSDNSNFTVDANPTAASRLNVTGTPGTATIGNNVTVNVVAEAGTYGYSTQYTVLDAIGGVSGTFASVNSNLAFLTPSLSYDTNNVYLTLTRNSTSFAGVASSPNQVNVGGALDSAVAGGGLGGDMTTLINNLYGLSGSGARSAFDSLGGAAHSYAELLAGRLGRGLLGTAMHHRPGGQGGVDGLRLAFAGDGQVTTLADNTRPDAPVLGAVTGGYGNALWGRAYHIEGRFDATANLAGADYTSNGAFFGRDLGPVGFGGGYARSEITSSGTQLDVDSYQAALYGRREFDRWYASGAAGLGVNQVDSRRNVVVGSLSRVANASYRSYSSGLELEAGRNLAVSDAVTFTPYAGLAYDHEYRQAFTEHGADAANLDVAKQQNDSVRSSLGARLQGDFGDPHHTRFHPAAYCAWIREWGDTGSSVDATFAGAPSSRFTVLGQRLARNRAAYGVSLGAAIRDDTMLSLAWDGEYGQGHRVDAASARLEYRW